MQDSAAKSMGKLAQNNHVQIIETEASIRCGLRPSTFYELVVEMSQIVLQQDNKILFLWPFKHVRRYGYTSNSFSIEAGSKCTTGEGLFIFRSHKSSQLYNQIIYNVNRIKQLKTRQLLQRSSNVSMDREESTEEDAHTTSLNTCTTRADRSDMVALSVPHYLQNECEYAQVVKR